MYNIVEVFLITIIYSFQLRVWVFKLFFSMKYKIVICMSIYQTIRNNVFNSLHHFIGTGKGRTHYKKKFTINSSSYYDHRVDKFWKKA